MIILRAALMLLVGSLAVAAMAVAAPLAQETNTRPSVGEQALPPAFDPTARIKYLYDRLRITAEQEPLWDSVAQTIRDNAREILPLLKERLRATTTGNASDVLHAYEASVSNVGPFAV
jgi:hypothetical protein